MPRNLPANAPGRCSHFKWEWWEFQALSIYCLFFFLQGVEGWAVTQLVEWLASVHKAFGSTPNTPLNGRIPVIQAQGEVGGRVFQDHP